MRQVAVVESTESSIRLEGLLSLLVIAKPATSYPPLRRRLPHSASSGTVGARNSLVLGDDGQIDYARADRPNGGRS